MKKLSIFTSLLLTIFIASAQNDTVIYFGSSKVYLSVDSGQTKVRVTNANTDSAEFMLFEGIYDDSTSKETIASFGFSKLIKSKRSSYIRPHSNNLFLGFSSLADRNLNIADAENAMLKYNSFEWGWTAFTFELTPPKTKQKGILFHAGLGIRMHQYNAENNTAFRLVNHYTTQVAAPDDIVYSTSKLTNWYVHLPALIEWQIPVQHTNFFIQGGLECGIKLSAKSKIMYYVDNKKTKEKIGSDLNVNPLTLDVKLAFGFGSYGLYARYGLLREFRKGRGPEVYPVAVGIVVVL
ncbi:MAG: hypothetical protein WC142_02865 [Bacteroidales bacterium]|jgi:hypothetical protein|nr:hypothetical protein [Bacteroidales bacterium]MDD2687038.1 hypothetical protein [Bacteroidales bacterium]MDD3329923.1 hypothetical protein [Bacteroidales bacterium]MDD3691653.1 hypothetical protein [Bacteroidales bacterium]MDD4044169.1 hypothetical protein [Bacteroidales bacterium]